ANATKVRTLKGGKILAGFAGAAADAFTLFEKFEEKLERYPGNLPRAAVELAKDWRSDRVLRRRDALLPLADKEHGLVVTGGAVARGRADAGDRSGAGRLHRGPGRGQEGRGERGAERRARLAGAGRDPRRDRRQRRHQDRPHRRGEGGDRAAAGAARRGAVP